MFFSLGALDDREVPGLSSCLLFFSFRSLCFLSDFSLFSFFSFLAFLSTFCAGFFSRLRARLTGLLSAGLGGGLKSALLCAGLSGFPSSAFAAGLVSELLRSPFSLDDADSLLEEGFFFGFGISAGSGAESLVTMEDPSRGEGRYSLCG